MASLIDADSNGILTGQLANRSSRAAPEAAQGAAFRRALETSPDRSQSIDGEGTILPASHAILTNKASSAAVPNAELTPASPAQRPAPPDQSPTDSSTGVSLEAEWTAAARNPRDAALRSQTANDMSVSAVKQDDSDLAIQSERIPPSDTVPNSRPKRDAQIPSTPTEFGVIQSPVRSTDETVRIEAQSHESRTRNDIAPDTRTRIDAAANSRNTTNIALDAQSRMDMSPQIQTQTSSETASADIKDISSDLKAPIATSQSQSAPTDRQSGLESRQSTRDRADLALKDARTTRDGLAFRATSFDREAATTPQTPAPTSVAAEAPYSNDIDVRAQPIPAADEPIIPKADVTTTPEVRIDAHQDTHVRLTDTVQTAARTTGGETPVSPLLVAGTGAPQSTAPVATPQSTMVPTQAIITAQPSDIVDIVSQALPSGDDPKDRIMIQLDPPELGRVSIEFRFEANGLSHVTITGENPEALRQLRQMHYELLQALEREGLSSQDMTFREGHAQHQQHSGSAQFDAKQIYVDRPETQSDTQPASPSRRTVGIRGPEGLDIRV